MQDRRYAEYGDGFYKEAKLKSLGRGAADVVAFLKKFLDLDSIVDVGCGRGHWLAEFGAAGATQLVGIDGPWNDGKTFVDPRITFQSQDMETGLTIHGRNDISVCLEVVEHVTPEAGERIVAQLCNAADVVLFSAAIVAQPGVHHINCQYPSYWHERFASQGFFCIDALRPRYWGNDELAPHYQQNLLIYAKEGSAAAEALTPLDAHRQDNPRKLDLVHPFVYEIQVRKFRKTRQTLKYYERLDRSQDRIRRLTELDLSIENSRGMSPRTGAGAFISANFGNYDNVRPFSSMASMLAEKGWDSFYFTDNPKIYDEAVAAGWDSVYLVGHAMRRLEPRLRAKLFKIRPHSVSALQGYGQFMWLDASIDIREPEPLLAFIDSGAAGLEEGTDVIQLSPHSRKTLAAEFDFILKNANHSPYLDRVLAEEPVREQLDFYTARDVDLTAPLWTCNAIFRGNSRRLNAMCDLWWEQNLMLSSRDQLSLPVCLAEFGIRPKARRLDFTSALKRIPHKGFRK